MKKLPTHYLCLILFSFTFIASKSQTTNRSVCIGNIALANSLYEKGQFSQAIALLEPCLKSGALNNNLVDAYRIIGLSYLQMNDEKKTEEAIFHLLKAKPNYQLFPYDDPIEFTNIMNRFHVEKKLIIGLKTGFNFTVPEITAAKSVKSPTTIEISGNGGLFFGVNANYFLKKQKFVFNPSLTITKLIFNEKHTFNSQERLSYKQEENLVDLSMKFKYFPRKKSKWSPHIGIGPGILIFRNGLSNIDYTNDFSVSKVEISRDLKATASKIRWNAIIDGGITIKTGNAILSLGLEYNYSFSNVLNTEKRYNDVWFNITNQYVDSDVKLHYTNFYLNYSFPILWRVSKL